MPVGDIMAIYDIYAIACPHFKHNGASFFRRHLRCHAHLIFSCQECPVEEEQVRQKAPEASIGPWPKQAKYGTVIGVWAFSNNALVHTCSYTC